MRNLAVVGAGGLVGRRVVRNLSKSNIDGLELVLTGLGKSVGTSVPFGDKTLTIRKTDVNDLKSMDAVILCTPTSASRELADALVGGPVIIDTSSAFRMDPEVPLVVPEVNPEDALSHKGLIAGPNCSTIQLVMVLKPILSHFGLERVYVSTYQAVSGVGYQAMEQLEDESESLLFPSRAKRREYETQFPHQIGFNLIPQIDSFLDDGYTKEEMKMVNETRKILRIPELRISTTCVRVPVFIGHSEACLVETSKAAGLDELRSVLRAAPGLVVEDDPKNSVYPMPINARDTDEVYVGRIRKDLSSENGVLLWVVADNLYRGAATNAVNVFNLLAKNL
ncbi:MAG: aspartate-semialdehyde dehydrogenase [Bacillota bacterium]